MKVYRCKFCGAVKSKKGAYFRVPDENKVKKPGQLENPGKMRLMLHLAAAHLSYEGEFNENSYEIVDI